MMEKFNTDGLYDEWRAKMDSVPMEGRLSKLGEEAAELSAAIQKYLGGVKCGWPARRTNKHAYKKIIEEAADVLGMLAACGITFDSAQDGVAAKLEKAVKFKMERFVGRVHPMQESPDDDAETAEADKEPDNGTVSHDDTTTPVEDEIPASSAAGPYPLCNKCKNAATCQILLRRREEAKKECDIKTADDLKKKLNKRRHAPVRLVVTEIPHFGYIPIGFDAGGFSQARDGVCGNLFANPWRDGIAGDFE